MRPGNVLALCTSLVSVLAINVTVYSGLEHVLEFPAGDSRLSVETFFKRLSRSDACSVVASLEDSVAGTVQEEYRRFLHDNIESRGVIEITSNVSTTLEMYSKARCSGESVLAFVDSENFVESAVLLSQYRRKEIVLVMAPAADSDEGAILKCFRTFYDYGFLRFAIVTLNKTDGEEGTEKSISGGVAVKNFSETTLLIRGVDMTDRLMNVTKLKTVFRVGVLNIVPIFYVTGRTHVFPPYTGHSAKIFSFLAAAIGAEPQFLGSFPGNVLPNGTSTGDVAYILRDVLDAGGIQRQVSLWADVLDFVYPVVEDDYCFAVAKAKPLPPEKVLLAAFHESLALALIATLTVFTAGLFMSYMLVLPRVTKVALVADAATAVFRAFVTGTLEGRTRWSSAGVFSMSVVFLNIIMMSVVQSSVFSLYSSPHKPSEIDTIQELLRYSEYIYAPQYLGDFFRSLDDQDRTLHDVAAKLKDFNVSAVQETLHLLISQGTSSMLMTRNFFRGVQRTRDLRDDEGLQTVHTPKECLLAPVYLTFPVSRRLAPFRLDRKLVRAEAAGLVAKWMADTWFELETLGVYQSLEPSRRQSIPRPLVLRHIDPAIKSLLYGTSVAAVVFVVEALTGKWRCWIQALRHIAGQRRQKDC